MEEPTELLDRNDNVSPNKALLNSPNLKVNQ